MVHGLQRCLPENDCKLDNAHLVIRFWLLRIKMLDTLDSLKNIGGHRLDLLREGNCVLSEMTFTFCISRVKIAFSTNQLS